MEKILKPKITLKFWLRNLLWRHLIGLFVVVFSIFPLLWVASAAFDEVGQLSTQTLIPKFRGLENFRMLFSNPNNPFTTWIRNSLVVASVAAILQILIGASAAYALSRYRFKGRKVMLSSIVLVQMFPQLLAATSIYLMINTFGKSFAFLGPGHQIPLILIFTGSALGINTWMLKGFFDTVPTEIDEAARVDGAGHFIIFIGIILPLVIPVLVVNFVLSFISLLNEYLITSVILGLGGKSATVAVGLQQFIIGQYGKNWGPFAAGALIATIPVLLLFIFLQKWLVSGLVSGSTKG